MKITIVGAGPSGLFLAHRLLARSKHYQVQIFEKLDAPNSIDNSNSQEFGFGFGTKAQEWLKSIDGLWELLLEQSVSLESGRLILISRRHLCASLLQLLNNRYGTETIKALPRLSVEFNTSVLDVFLESREILIEQASVQQRIAYELLVAADGVRSKVRSAMVASNPQIYAFKQKSRPHVWKVFQLPEQPNWERNLIRLQKRNFWSIDAFGACIPHSDGRFSALIFWQPKGDNERLNPCGISTCEQIQVLLHQMKPTLPYPVLEQDSASAFLNERPSFEYWSECSCYHHVEGCVVAIGDAAHSMFSLLGQGCTAALADAIALDTLLERYDNDLTLALPAFSDERVPEGQAASNLSLIALVFFTHCFN
ncbi:FAD-dependent monooxygenase [Candidatus Gracilibacteria bacterium]|nr:FAD-dependent monooxygenase [Candidatus Gracilibacteria bacterium]NJP22305.1 FAD-dependent monooxygenase [Hydrococcus sp. CRU_1_1]